jgi:hypothetical protein
VMIAAAASGLIAPGLFHHMSTDSPAAADAWRTAMALNGHLNKAFALIFTVASSGCDCDLVNSNPQKQHLQPGTRNLRLHSGLPDHPGRSFRTYTA